MKKQILQLRKKHFGQDDATCVARAFGTGREHRFRAKGEEIERNEMRCIAPCKPCLDEGKPAFL